MSARRQLAEQLARAARYGALDPAVTAIEAALQDAEVVGACAFMDSWVRRVGERIAADLDLGPKEVPVAKS